MQLLVSGHGPEILECTLKKDARLTLVPPDADAPLTETWYLLSGTLHCELLGRLFTAGDYLSADGLEAPVILTAVSDVRFLYVSSQPFFHELSGNMKDLTQLAVEVELKDGYTAEHCARLQRLSCATGTVLGLGSRRLHLLDYGAYLHDVGKTKVPVEILQKPTELTAEEWRIIKQHPTFGRELLEPTFMSKAGEIVEQHHERMDGSGYPYGLAGDEVCAEAYVVAVADTYDAMTTDRPYRQALSPAVAFAELDKFAGVHYPKDVVRAFREAVRKVG